MFGKLCLHVPLLKNYRTLRIKPFEFQGKISDFHRRNSFFQNVGKRDFCPEFWDKPRIPKSLFQKVG